MRLNKFLIILLAIFILSTGYAHTLQAQPDLSASLQKIIEQENAANAFWSVTVRNSAGNIIGAHNSEKLVSPASNLKLLTSAAVLDELGSDFRFKTSLYATGSQEGSVWNGNIIIRGMGDPSLSGKFYNDDRFYIMDKLYNALQARGIEKINGRLIGNDSYFDKKAYPDGWSWDDLSFYYAVPISALSFNNNTVDLTVYANGQVGEMPQIEWFPFDTDYVNFINDQIITPPNAEYDEYYQRLLGTNTVLLQSTLPQGYVEKEALSVMDPPRFFLDTFKKYLQNGGIAVEGPNLVDSQPHRWTAARYQQFVVHESPPLRDLLKQLNKESDNFYAEMVLKTAAAERYNTQGTTQLGVALVKEFARSLQLDTSNISLSDGSGMSATTLITTRDLSKLLSAMQQHREFKSFKNSLAVSGRDGSLKNRFKRSSLIGRVQAKTGYVSGVRTLSGYLQTKSNETLIFSIATNHYTANTSYIDSLHERMLEELYATY